MSKLPNGRAKLHEAFIKSAEFRVHAVSYINKLQDFETASKIYEGLKAEGHDFGFDFAQASAQFRNLAEASLVEKKIGEGKEFLYLGKGADPKILEGKTGPSWKKQVSAQMGEPLAVQQVGPEPLKQKKQKEEPVILETPTRHIKLDVVKATGRVRLTVEGLTIEIGIVDK